MKKRNFLVTVILILSSVALLEREAGAPPSLFLSPWVITTVDSSSGAFPSIAIDAQGKAYISYFWQGTSLNKIRFATNRSGAWVTQYLYPSDPPWTNYGTFSSLAVTGDKVYTCYHLRSGLPAAASLNKRLEIWSKDFLSGTVTRTVADEGGAAGAAPVVGQYCALGVDSSGKAYVTYADNSNLDIRYVYQTDTGWSSPVTVAGAELTGQVRNVGPWNSLAVAPDGSAHLVYYHSTDTISGTTTAYKRLRYIKKPAGELLFSSATRVTVDSGTGGIPDVGRYNAVAVDSAGHIHTCYYDNTNSRFKYATNEGGAWAVQDLSTRAVIGDRSCSVAFGNNKIHFSYVETAIVRNLVYASKVLGSPTITRENVVVGSESAETNPWQNVIAVDPSGGVHIAFQSVGEISQNLQYAYKAPLVTDGGGGGGGGGCIPTTCGAMSASCGDIPDGCGVNLHCGDCTSPQTCGGGGTANVCGGSCMPQNCQSRGLNCGDVSDGCGGTVHCGDCTSPQTCGGGGTANVCGAQVCIPKSCVSLGKNCGDLSNGCDGVLHCGSCAPPTVCGGSGVANLCALPGPTPSGSPDPIPLPDTLGEGPQAGGGGHGCSLIPEE